MLQLCNAHGDWEKGWEKILTESLEKKLAKLRKQDKKMKLKQCVDDFEEMKKKRSGSWESPEVEVMKLNVFFFTFFFKILKKKKIKAASFQHP